MTAEEIVSLDLSGLGWAMSSACGTELGEARTGEEVFGLSAAGGPPERQPSVWDRLDETERAEQRECQRQREAERVERERPRRETPGGFTLHPFDPK